MNEYVVIKSSVKIEDVYADSFGVGQAGELWFRVKGSLTLVYAPGTWFKVEKQ